MKSYGIVFNDINNLNFIIPVVKWIKSNYQFADINIFSSKEVLLDNPKIASLSMFYLKFFDGSVIFLNAKDYTEYRGEILSNSIFLLTSVDDLLSNNLSKQSLSNVTLLTIESGDIHAI